MNYKEKQDKVCRSYYLGVSFWHDRRTEFEKTCSACYNLEAQDLFEAIAEAKQKLESIKEGSEYWEVRRAHITETTTCFDLLPSNCGDVFVNEICIEKNDFQPAYKVFETV